MTAALGVGSGTAIFSVVDAGWLRPLPFDDASALVSLWMERPLEAPGDRIALTGADIADFRAEPGLFAAVSGWEPIDPVLAKEDGGEVVPAAAVTEGLFSRVLRAHPLLGRTFLPDEDRPGALPTVVLGHGFWRDRFAGDPTAIGRSVVLDGVPHLIVGVMPSGFRPPFRPEAALWTSARLPTSRCRGDCRALTVVARLAPGTGLPVARARAVALTERLRASYPDTNGGMSAGMEALGRDLSLLSAEEVRRLLTAAGLVFLVACANLGMLLVVRGTVRAREMSIRASMGASPRALRRELVWDGTAVALVGGFLGTGLAVWALEGLERAAPHGLVGVRTVDVDASILLAALGLSLATGILAGLLPAWILGGLGRRPVRALSGWSGGSSPPGSMLSSGVVAVEIALAAMLAVVAGSTIHDARRSVADLAGSRGEDLLVMEVLLPADRLGPSSSRSGVFDAIRRELEGMPGAFSVGMSSGLPLTDVGPVRRVLVEGEPEDPSAPPPRARVRSVSPGFFYTVGQRLREGRGFQIGDDASGEAVAIVDASAARRLFGDPPRSPLGARIALGGGDDAVRRAVVGVVEDAPGEDRGGAGVIYLPFDQADVEILHVAVRVDGDPGEAIAEARAALGRVDPALALGVAAPARELAATLHADRRFVATISSVSAAVALLLSVLALYALIAHDMGRRMPELGLRKALGATEGELRYQVAQRAVAVTTVAILVGALVAGSRLGKDQGRIVGTWSDALPVYGGALALVAISAMLAMVHTSRGAAGVDVVSALQGE
ncbi:MAG: ABC transporter permease [Longimicrobiales bacterium]|nr:ABC transporter permease [Longimicrobiales bacterium]